MTKPDALFGMSDLIFTHGEAVEIAGVSAKSLNNWTQREIINVGELHRTGRRKYSVTDLILLKIIADLTRLGVSASVAITIAENARPAVSEPISENEDQQFYVCWSTQAGRYTNYRRVKGAESLAKLSQSYPMIVVPLNDVRSIVVKAAAKAVKKS